MKKRSMVAGASVLALALLAAPGLLAPAGSAGAKSAVPTPITGEASDYAVSISVRDLKPSHRDARSGEVAPPRVNPLAGEADHGSRDTRDRADTPQDPLASSSSAAGGRTPDPGLSFEGTGNPAACGGCSPPDTIGDVGPNHYIQMVNATKVAIYNKAGTLLTPIFDLGSLWSTGSCTANAGDPVVQYDEQADRWLLSQFFDGTGSNDGLCIAISQTADPLGAYHLYTFNVGSFPDYFKLGMWPNAYYVSANESTYTAYAFDRAKMLAGDQTAGFIKFTGQTNFLMPADVDGPTQPTGGGLFYTFKDDAFASHGGGVDRIELFQLTPDFVTPAASTFLLINTFPIASFTYTVCGFFVFNCIPQGGTTQKVDPVSEWPMQRLAFRRFGGHEALVGNFTVKSHTATATTAGAGIRWFELRNTGSGWSLFQEGTHDPNDGLDRWMGSIAVDQAGNIALGYSASSGSVFPSIRYATRVPGDPAGTLQAEKTLQAGGGSQTGSNRWGDYSAMSVDPVDDCTFWYTNEYYPASAPTTWKTRIGNFLVPGCAAVFSANPPSINFGNQDVGTSSPAQTVTVTNTGNENLTIGSAALTTGNASDFAKENDTCTGATLTPTQTCTVGARFAPTATGLRATELRFTDNAADSPHDVHLAGNGTPSNSFTFGRLKRNRRKGTAKLTIEVPGPGVVRLTGPGVRSQRPATRSGRRASSKPVAAAGQIQLPIKAKGKKKRKLNRTGKVKVKVKVTFTPSGGSPASKSKSVKLKRRLP